MLGRPVVAIAMPGQAKGCGERVFGDEVVAGLAAEQADGGVFIGCLDLGVHGDEVEVELASVAGFEGVKP